MNNIKFFFDSSNVSKMNHVSFDLLFWLHVAAFRCKRIKPEAESIPAD